ncbi:MAG TPA: ATP synthase F1 subunit delta [Chitinophagaceae bacterium]|nr:ATP synthase F1 subunit delta [Chitinophagaceae bacterium]
MPNPRLAARYAKSLIDLSIEKGGLEEVYADMLYLQAVCKASRDFVNLLRSPVVKGDKKESIINAVTKGKISALTAAFITLLVNKSRESDLPEIVSAFIDQYNSIKGIHRVKLSTAVPVSDEVKQDIVNKVKSSTGLANIELETKTDESLIGGFVLEFDNNLVDASILRDLRDVRRQFTSNLYEHNIR